MINDVFAIIDWNQSQPLRPWVEKISQDAIVAAGFVSEIVLDRPEMCLGIVRQPNSQGGVWHQAEREIILQGKICQGIDIDSSWANLPLAELGQNLWDGVYNLLVWCQRTQSLLVTSDYLSIKSLYYWQQDGITVISSTLKAFRLLPWIPQSLNPQVLASTIALSHPLSDDTLIAGVKVLPHQQAGIFKRDGIELVPRCRSQGVIEPGVSTEEYLQELDRLMTESCQTWLNGSPQTLISLSGGLDSRLLLGYLKRSPTQLTAGIWGEPGSDDFKLGIELAQATNTEYLTYILTENTAIAPEDLAFPGWQTESFSVNNVPLYWRGWIELLQAQQLPVVHGFLGGPLGGGRVSKWGVTPDNLHREVDQVIVDELTSWGQNTAPEIIQAHATAEFLPYLTTGIAEDLVKAFTSIEQPYVYQRLMGLDFYYRQRRYLGNAISKILGTFLPTMLPFYTKNNLDFVLQLPWELISGRTIFRQLLLEQFSGLANFQEADKGTLPIYTNPVQKYRDRLLENRYIWYLFPKLKPRNSALVFSLLLEKNLPLFLDTIKDSAMILSNYIDVSKLVSQLESGNLNRRDRSQIMRLFNICTFINRYFN